MRDDYMEYGYRIIIRPLIPKYPPKKQFRIWVIDENGKVVYSTPQTTIRLLRYAWEDYRKKLSRQIPEMSIPFPPLPPDVILD